MSGRALASLLCATGACAIATASALAPAHAVEPQTFLSLRDPDWSPDGRRLAFTAECSGFNPPARRSAVFTVSTRGGAARSITSPRFIAASPAWSPDGRRLAFRAATAAEPERAAIYVAPVATRAPRRVVQSALAPLSGPTWSPDGRRLAYTSATELRAVDVRTGDDTLLTATQGEPRDPAWSPLGVIAAVGTRSISAFDLERGEWRFIAGPSGIFELSYVAPDWSPAGTRIAFTRFYDGDFTVTVARADGTGARALVPGFGPAWSPDGRRIVYARRRGFRWTLRTVDVRTAVSRPVRVRVPMTCGP